MKIFYLLLISTFFAFAFSKKIAIIGGGVIGVSTALAFKIHIFSCDITIFEDRPYTNITSYVTPGVHRVQKFAERKWAAPTFQHFLELFRDFGGEAGIQRISGYVLSEDEGYIIEQEENYGNIVHDFQWLEEKDMFQFTNDKNKARNISGVHFTTYTAEGRLYLPWIREQVKKHGVKFFNRHIETINELLNEDYDIVINCAGVIGGKVAADGDEKNTYPVRGVLFEIDSAWQKNFIFNGAETYTKPLINGVIIGTQMQKNDTRNFITDEDRKDIFERCTALQPSFKKVSIKNEWVAFRPGRKVLRLEAKNVDGKLVIHNYGHDSAGVTSSWGCALDVLRLALEDAKPKTYLISSLIKTITNLL